MDCVIGMSGNLKVDYHSGNHLGKTQFSHGDKQVVDIFGRLSIPPMCRTGLAFRISVYVHKNRFGVPFPL